ncbi:MAG: hypothetical protein ABSG93_19335 [Solirubrobacteraceae bacterium]|jgi:hypothetical protein
MTDAAPDVPSRSNARLHPADIAAIASAVVEQLREAPAEPAGRFVDAATLAREIGVETSWVYRHKDKLRAVALGDGPRARLRFPAEVMGELASARAVSKASPAQAAPRRRRSRGARAGMTRAGNPLLPVNGEGV